MELSTTDFDSLPEDSKQYIDRISQYLYPSEEIVSIYRPQIVYSDVPVSSLKSLYDLVGGTTYGDIGKNGPTLAAISSEANQDVESLTKYEAVFGRDSLRVCLDLLDIYPQLAKTTVVQLAQTQGTKINNKSGEEPGRIIHESRNPQTDPIARQLTVERGWDWPYYESIDATLMFITSINRIVEKDGVDFLNNSVIDKDGNEILLKNSFDNAVAWAEERLDASRRGFIETKRIMGVEPETWKDSWDAFTHKDGSIANTNDDIASLEVQALAYDALIDASDLYKKTGENTKTDSLLEKAKELQRKLLEGFWVDDDDKFGGYFCQGLDYDKEGVSRQIKTRTSDMGHLLNSRILESDDPDIVAKKESIIKNLFSKEMLNASGIRTLASDEKRFRPGGYHTGSVWLWENYFISQGLCRHGYYGLASLLKKRMWDVVDKFNCIPEYARGDDEDTPQLNEYVIEVNDMSALVKKWDGSKMVFTRGYKYLLEQIPQEIQAWSVAAIVASKFDFNPLQKKYEADVTKQDKDKINFEEQILRYV